MLLCVHDSGPGLCSLQNSLCTLVLHFTYILKKEKKWSFLLETCSSEADIQLVQTGSVLLKHLPSFGLLRKVLDSERSASAEKEGSGRAHRVYAGQQHLGHVGVDLLQGQLPAEEEVGEQPSCHSLPSFHLAPNVPQLVVDMNLACLKTVFLLKEVWLSINHLFKWYKWTYLQNRLTEFTVGEGD